jgi:hypothetical protein
MLRMGNQPAISWELEDGAIENYEFSTSYYFMTGGTNEHVAKIVFQIACVK